MENLATNPKQEAHELIESMAPGQVEAVVGLLKVMLDPAGRSLANASIEDEPVSEEETSAASLSKAWLQGNSPIPNEDILAGFGLTGEDFERLGRTPIEPRTSGR